MSYITSCLPLRGCRSLCTLESCNTFPCFSFPIQQEETMLIVPQWMCMCLHIHEYMHQTRRCDLPWCSSTLCWQCTSGLLGRLQIDTNTCLVHLTLILFIYLFVYLKSVILGERSQQNWILPSLSYAILLELLQRRNRRIKLNAQFGQAFQWVASLLMAGGWN